MDRREKDESEEISRLRILLKESREETASDASSLLARENRLDSERSSSSRVILFSNDL